MLIAEHFILIATDPDKGMPVWPRREQDIAQLFAAGLLLDLAILQRLRMRDSLLHADASSSLSHALLNEALHELALRPLSAAHAVALLERRLHPLSLRVPESLYHRDILHRVESRTWLLRRRLRFPLRSVQARNEALQRLHQALRDADDLHGLGLLLLIDVSGLLPAHLDAREHATATQQLLALNNVADDDPMRQMFAAVRSVLLA